MYQTVGHDAIDFYADCMQLPLYRREITGTAIAQGANYEVTPQDETEDLYVLLKEVLVSLLCVYIKTMNSNMVQEKHPDVKGVSVGAILSSYQKVRVENV